MKPIGELKILNRMPHILMSHEDLCAIQHIVKIAPKEAQWFHCVQRVNEDDNIYYKVHGMFIPEQYCSAVEVESDPMMMVKFYKELKEKHGEEETNAILASMTAWSHSHHDMGVNPSGQDRKQFHEQCVEAEKQNITAPQLMMIFNRKDDYYARLWDPELGMEYENLSIIIEGYDFSWITEAAKEKFKKKEIIRKPMAQPWGRKTNAVIDFNQFEMFQSSKPTKPSGSKKKLKIKRRQSKTKKFDIKAWHQSKKYNQIIYLQDDIQSLLDKIESAKSTENVQKLMSFITSHLEDQELLIFYILLCGSDEDIWDLEEFLPKVTMASKEDAIVELHDEFIDGLVTADQITHAMATAIACRQADSSESAEKILDMWLTIYHATLDHMCDEEEVTDLYDLWAQQSLKPEM